MSDALKELRDAHGTAEQPPAWFREYEERQAQFFADMFGQLERKLTGHVTRQIEDIKSAVNESAAATRDNSEHLADGVLKQMRHTEELVKALAEGHERMGAAHGHTSVKIREILANGTVHEGENGGE